MTSVVVICLDSVRKDYFDRYADEIQSMSDFSMSGSRAASCWSVPSHASFLTGVLPTEHGIHTDNLDFSTVPRQDVLTGQLGDHHSTYISANQFTTPEFGFDAWFDSGYPISEGRYFHEGIDATNSTGIRDHIHRSLRSDHKNKSILNGMFSKLSNMAGEWPIAAPLDDGCKSISKRAISVASEQNDDIFMFINMMEGHLPHRLFRGMDQEQFDLSPTWHSNSFDHWEYNESNEEKKGDFREEVDKFRDFYSASIEYLDRQVAKLIESLQDTLEDNLVTIVMADHGENLGGEDDRYLMEHTGALTEGVLHVPFEVVNSPIEISGTDSPFSLCELPDLITAIIEGEDYTLGERPVSAEVLGEGLHLDSKESDYWNRAIRCTYVDGERFEWDTLGNSYRVAVTTNGPSTESIIEEGVTVGEDLKNRFNADLQSYKDELSENSGKSGGVSETTESRLRELGYL